MIIQKKNIPIIRFKRIGSDHSDLGHEQPTQEQGTFMGIWSGQGLKINGSFPVHHKTIHSTTYIKKQSRRSQSKEWPIDPNRPGSHGHHPRPCPVTLGHTSHLRSSVSRGDFLLFLLCLLLVFLSQIHPLDHTPKNTRNTPEQSLGSNRPIQGLCLSFSLEFSLCFSLCGMSKNRPEWSEMRERGRLKLSPTAWANS